MDVAVDLTMDATSEATLQSPVKHSTLTSAQKSILCTNAWLDDTLINLGQLMLKAKYQYINGLQSVLLAEKLALIPQPDEFLQLLNDHNNHWILISTIGCPPTTVNVYDSLHGTLSPKAQRVVADLIQSQVAYVTIQYVDVQWQSNGYDCGLFALANATALCDGTDPSTLSFDQSKMRQHFLACIEKNNLQQFPVRGQRRIIRPPHIQKVEVFCVCRLPDDGSEMIQCCQCQEWFHTSCIRVPRAWLKNPNIPWLCTSCK